MRETAYAKINLALHVRSREPDGYHDIETVFAFTEDGDELNVAPGEGIALAVEGPFAADLGPAEDNLVLKAARMLRERYDVGRGAVLRLDKRLPVASGIGGGSADAAAALRLLARWWDLPADEAALLAIGRALGADVPACILSRAARGEGRGDRLVPLDNGLAGTPVLLVNPRVPVSTAAAFAGWDGVDRGPLSSAIEGRNDLEPSARAIAPAIGEVLARLKQMKGTRLVRMSGSGATCFALFDGEAERDAAAVAVRTSNPGWWSLASRLR